MAENIIRRSPVTFARPPVRTEVRGHWTVVLEFEDEGTGPWVVDLSHRSRWDLQDREIGGLHPWDLNIPDGPGKCGFKNGILINRMNRTQASIWHLAGERPDSPPGNAYTDTTDATILLALIGKNLSALMEKLTSLDFFHPLNPAPFLLQGPVSHVPCQCVVLDKSPQRAGILYTCSRGYARSMVEGLLEAGAEFGLRPAGENAFNRWLMDLQI